VLAGYVVALVAGIVAARMYDVWAAAQPYDTSGGMYAAGQGFAALGAFLVVALVPTVLALWFLPRHETFWNAVAFASLAYASAGLVAVLTQFVFHDSSNLMLMIVGLVGVSQMLGVPLWCVAFALFALLAPFRAARRKLVLATALELVIGACMLVRVSLQL
jgi:hypothetical protein